MDSIYFNFFWVFQGYFNKHSWNFDDFCKIGCLGLLEMKIFQDKYFEVMTYAHDVSNKILSCDPSYILEVVMSQKFGNPNISMGVVIIASIL